LIELSYFEEKDIPQLIGWIGNPEFLLQWAGMSLKYPLDIKQLKQYIKMANQDDSDILTYKVIHRESNRTIGHISLGNINRENGTARMCRVLIGDKSMHGKGIGQQMVQEVLKIAFSKLNLHKVSLAVFDFNLPAINLYEKLGFKTEGLIREACKIGDDYWSYFEMSILEREWQAIVGRKQE